MFAVAALATLAITCQSAVWFCRAVIPCCTIRARSQLTACFMGGSRDGPSCQLVGIPAMGSLSPLSKLLLAVVCPRVKILLQVVLTGRYSSSMICGTQSDLDVSATAEVVPIIRERQKMGRTLHIVCQSQGKYV